jgi:succinyl-CoA synthetase beta subunit
MNIHEYQARELFAKFGVATQPGGVAFSPEEAEQVATRLGGRIVVKAQIHAGASRGLPGGSP